MENLAQFVRRINFNSGAFAQENFEKNSCLAIRKEHKPLFKVPIQILYQFSPSKLSPCKPEAFSQRNQFIGLINKVR